MPGRGGACGASRASTRSVVGATSLMRRCSVPPDLAAEVLALVELGIHEQQHRNCS
jgi:hypothetical protein